jgi:hypothetical protein
MPRPPIPAAASEGPLSNCWAGVINCIGRKPRRPPTAKIRATKSVRMPGQNLNVGQSET